MVAVSGDRPSGDASPAVHLLVVESATADAALAALEALAAMLAAADGSIWAGTWGGGASRFDGKAWSAPVIVPSARLNAATNSVGSSITVSLGAASPTLATLDYVDYEGAEPQSAVAPPEGEKVGQSAAAQRSHLGHQIHSEPDEGRGTAAFRTVRVGRCPRNRGIRLEPVRPPGPGGPERRADRPAGPRGTS